MNTSIHPRSKAGKLDILWLERMHDNRALVPEHPQHLSSWARRSRECRESRPCVLDIPYGPGPNESLDVFPAAPQNRRAPVLVFIHGGYWRALDKSDHSFMATSLVDQGACVVVPNYALCPQVSVADITLQMAKAMLWVWRHIADYGGDPSHIVVGGHSAGGHLAAMMMVCQWSALDADAPADLVKAALPISGLYELNRIAATPSLQASLRLTPDVVSRCSPAWLPTPRTGSVYTTVGGDESEEYLRHNQLLQKRWGAQVVPIAEVLPHQNHFSILDGLCDQRSRLNQLASQLLKL